MISFRNFLRASFTFAVFVPTLLLAQATRFIVTEAGGTNPLTTTTPLQSGVDANIRVTAVDEAGAVVTNYARDVVVSLPDALIPDARHARVAIPAAAFIDGIADNVVITPIHAGTGNCRVAVTDGNIATYNANLNEFGSPSAFSVAPARIAIGQQGTGFPYPFYVNGTLRNLASYTISDGLAFPTRVVAVNADGTIATSYTGSVTLNSSALANNVNVSIGFGGIVDTQFRFVNAGSAQTLAATFPLANAVIFDATAVIAGGDVINFSQVHNLQTGNSIIYSIGNGANTPVDGLTDGIIYYVIRVDETSIRLASTESDALAGVAITLNAPGTGLQSVQHVSVTADASGPFDVRPHSTTGGIATAANIDVRTSATVRPGDSISVTYELKATADAEVDSGDPEGTLSTVTLFNANNSITFLGNSNQITPASSSTNPAIGRFSITIPTTFPAGTYTLRINSGGTARNSDTTITVQGLPDLAIERFDYAPGTYEGGDVIRFDMAWRNLVISPGQTRNNALLSATINYRTEIHLSADDIFGNEDDMLVWTANAAGNFVELPYGVSGGLGDDLLPGQSVVLNAELKLPENRPGTYYLYAKVNSQGGRDGDYSTGFSEQVGPATANVAADGNNIVLPMETQKITIVPRTSTETTRVSVTSNGGQVSGNSDQAVISRDGAYATFQSLAAFAGVSGSNGFNQIYRKELSTGTVELVSQGAGSAVANGASTRPAISADGRYIVFESTATDLEPGDRNGFSDIYLRDVLEGITRRISRNGSTEANSGCFKPSISADGRFVVFASRATNLLPGTSSGLSQVYLFDRDVSGSGVFDTVGNTALTLVSSVGGVAGNSNSLNARISGDSRYVVFTTRATNGTVANNLLGGNAAPFAQIVRWANTATSLALPDAGTLLPISTGQTAVLADGESDFAAINGDGSQIAFVSRALNLTPGTTDTYASGVPHIYRATVSAGIVLSPLTRVNGYGDVEPNNINLGVAAPDLGSFEPSISENGQIIVFASESSNLLPPISVRHIDRTTYLSSDVQNYADGNFVADVYLADLSSPGNPLIERASISSLGYEATLRTTGTTYTTRVPSSRAPSISPDGRYVIFTNDGERHNALIFNNSNTDSVGNYPDSNASRDIFVFDRKTGLGVPSNLPTVSLLVPPAFTVSTGATVPLAVQASSATRGIASVEFYANNLLIGTSTTPSINGSGLYAYNWSVPTAGNGSTFNRIYEIVAVAVDNSGGRSLVSNSTRVTVLAKNTSTIPTILLTGPSSNGLIRAGSTVRISSIASDADRNLTGVEFFVNGVSVGDVPRVLAAGQTSGIYTTSWTNSGPGYYTILAQARDASGNKVLSQPTTIQIYPTVNPGMPSVSLTTPTASAISIKLGSSLRLVAAASDAGGTVSRVGFYANSNLVSLTNTVPYEGSFTPSSEGIYEVYAAVLDNDGNESISPQTITVTVTSDIQLGLGTGTNDLFVNQVLLDGDQNVALYPGDPIKYTVAYGRLNPGDQAHAEQKWRTSVYLSTDGNPNNTNNFLLTFFDGTYPKDEPTGRLDLRQVTNLLPPNYTGTYFLIATIRSTGGADNANGDNDTPSVFVTGATRVTILPADSPTVSRISSDANNGDANEFSESGTISSDGRYIVFQSEATNLVTSPAAPAGISQIYLRDTVTGVTTLISQRGGVAGNGESKYASLSVAGSNNQYFVAYQSAATNLVGGTGNTDSNQQTDVFLYEVATGITTRISVPSGSAPGLQANGGSFMPSISGNGDYVVFESDASNLVAAGAVPDTNGQRDIYLYNRSTKQVSALSTTSAGVFGAGASSQAQISEDGSTVIFRSFARNLAGSLISPSFARSIVYVKTLGSNPTTGSIIPISVLREPVGASASSFTAFNADAFDATVSANGRYVAFASRATNIPNADGVFNTDGKAQVYVVNRAVTAGAFDQTGNVSLSLVSAGRDPVTGDLAFGDSDSLAPTISGNGRYIGYRTEASNLQVETITRSDGLVFAADDIASFKDTNNTSDVYLRDTGISAINVTSPGAGYPNGLGIEVIITGGGGSGARALAIIENGEVARIDILDSGAGYSTPPTVIIPATGTTRASAVASIEIASERVSVSQYGQQTIGLIGSTLVPNSRDLKMSSDGRYILFTSDAANNAGFIFGKSNQLPLDSNGKRDIYLVDRKVGSYVTPVEGSAPTVTISMDSRPVSFGSSRVIRAEAFDGGDFDQVTNTAVAGKIQLIEIYANNQLLKRYVPSAPTSADSTSAIWLAPLSAGAVQLYAIVEDADGNRTRSQPVNITVSPPPSLEPTVTLQASATTLNIGQAVTLTATASDPDNGVKAVRFYSNGTAFARSDAPPYTATFIPSTSGTYELLALAYDKSDGGLLDDPVEFSVLRNTELSNAVNLLVLAPPAPTVKLISPAVATTTTVGSSVFIEVSAESNNNNATISTVEIFGNGQSIGTASRVGFTSRYRLTWKPTVAGVVSISAVATDTQQSRSSSAAKTVSVNAVTGTAPFVVVSSPVVDPAFGYATLYTSETTIVQMQALDLDGTVASVQLYISGRLLGTATRNGANFEYLVDGSTLPAGLYELVALATDNSGNITASAGVSVLVTARAATVSIVRPEQPVAPPQLVDVKRGQPVPFLFQATTPDSLTRVTQVALSVNGVTLPILATAVGTQGDYTLTWTPDITGIFTVIAVATDSLGATVNSSELQVRVTEPVGTAPTVQVISPASTGGTNPAPASTSVGSQLLFVATAFDNTAVTGVTFYADGVSIGAAARMGTTNQWVLNATLSGAPFNAKGVGSYAITAISSDADRNQTQSAVTTLNVTASSTSAPVVSLAVPVPSSVVEGRSTLLAASATPATGATISSVAFYVNGALVNTDATAPYSVSYTAPAVGGYTVRAVATDSAGNTSVSSAQSLTVTANSGPVVSISAPVLTVELGTPLAISATATDSDGMDRVVFTEYLATAINDPIKTTEDRLSPYGYQFSPTQTGQYIIRAQAFDDLGFSDTASLVVNVVRNAAKPTIAFVSPAVGATAVVGQATPVEVSVTVPTGATVNSISFYANGVKIGDGYKQGTLDIYRLLVDQNNTQQPWSPSVTGSLELTAEIVDSFGGRAETAVARQLQVVGQVGALPFVEIIQPVPPATTTGGTPASLTATTNSDLNLAASAVDSDGTVSSVEFFLDRGRPATPTATVTFPSVVVNGAALQQSTGYISSIAFADGGTGYLSPPEVRIIGDGSGATAEAEILNGAISRIRITNRGSGYTNAIVRLVGGGLVENLSIGSAVRDFSSDVWRLSTPFNFKSYGAGFYTFRAVAKDNNNNVQSSTAVSVTVSPAPLTTPVTGNLTSTPTTADVIGQRVPAGQNVQLSLSPTVVGGSVASVEFFANGESVGIDTAQPYVVNWVPSYVGSYNVVAVVADSAGNKAVSPALPVYVGGNIAPTVTLVRPGIAGAGGVVNQEVLLEAEATALSSGATVSSVEFIADGDSIGIGQQVGVSNRYVLSNWRPPLAKTYGITARVTDSFGQAVLATVRNLVVTAQVGVVPTVIITSPSGSTASGGTGVGGTSGGVSVSNNSALYLSAQANDADGSVASVEFLLSRGEQATATAVLSTLGSGIGSITVASPGSGYLFAPRVKIIGNGVGAIAEATVSGGEVTDIRIISSGSGYTSVPQVVIEGGGLYENTSIGSAIQTTGTRSWTYSLDLRNYDVGPYSIRARVTDNNGNTSISDPVAVTVTAATTGAPTLTLGQPVPTSVVLGRSVTLSAFPIAAPGASISNVAFYSNGYLIGQTTGAAPTSTGGATDPFQPTTPTAPNTPSVVGSSYSFVYTPPSSGSYTITAMVTDSAGNTALSSGSVVVTAVDNSAPQVTTFVMGTPATRFIGENVTLSATATDDQGVASVSLYVNNTLLETRTNAPYTFQHTPATEGSYIYTVTATDQLGKTGTYATAQVVTVIRSTLANVNTSSGNALNSVDDYYQSLLGRSPSRGELAVLESTVTSGITTDDYDYAMAKLAADLVRSEEFTKRGGASVILSYAAVLGRYPTPSEYAAGIASIQASGDVLFIAQLLARGEYTQQFGNTQLATTISANQYAAVRALALRLYQGVYGVAPKANIANAAAQSLLVSINGLGVGTTGSTTTAPGGVAGGTAGAVTGDITSLSDLVLANTISTYLTTQRASKDAALIDNRIRIVALYLAMDEVPAFADVTARQRSNIEVVADNIYNDAPLVESRPVFRLNPAAVSFVAGGSATLNVEVAASPRATLQWFKDRVPVQGATGKSLQVTTAGNYYVVATNAKGRVTSRTAKVAVTPLPPSVPSSVVLATRGAALASSIDTQPFAGAGLSYFARGLPAGLFIDSFSGRISGIVSERVRAQDYSIQVWTQSGTQRSETRAFVIRVQ